MLSTSHNLTRCFLLIASEKISRIKVLFLVFFRISLVAVGGGVVMLPLVQNEFVEKRRWMNEDEMVDCLAIVQSLPGLIGVNLSMMTGWKIAGLAGALAGTLGMIVPPFLIILFIAMLFVNMGESALIEQAFLGIRSAVCALILLSAVTMGKKLLKNHFSVSICVCAFLVLILFPTLNAAWVILAGAIAGLILKIIQKEKCDKSAGE